MSCKSHRKQELVVIRQSPCCCLPFIPVSPAVPLAGFSVTGSFGTGALPNLVLSPQNSIPLNADSTAWQGTVPVPLPSFNVNGVFDPVAGAFTAPLNGYYQVNASLFLNILDQNSIDGFEGAQNNPYVTLDLIYNASTIVDSSSSTVVSTPASGGNAFPINQTLVLNRLLLLTASDTLTLQLTANPNLFTPLTLSNQPSTSVLTNFSAILVHT